jgi:pyruvate/2-oxoglutarate dehydrogenase complex dihydrolipoamide acyltransferase (E2) component
MSVVKVQVPKLTMAAIEATFIEWLVGDGERVTEDQPLYIVATDKVETEVPSPASGVLRHGVAEAEVTYSIGTELAVIELP